MTRATAVTVTDVDEAAVALLASLAGIAVVREDLGTVARLLSRHLSAAEVLLTVDLEEEQPASRPEWNE